MLKSAFTKLLTTALLVVAFASAALATTWREMAGGQHTLQSLGEDYYVSVPMRPIAGARLLLFNRKVAKFLGLDLPEDPAELERRVLENFALEVDPMKLSSIRRMATRYQDSARKGQGEASGDGRAVWMGEVVLEDYVGKKRYLDVVMKGVGQTPLAWLNHSDPLHSDGLQSAAEAIHSFIVSQAAFDDGIDSTLDLAVIEIPSTKKNPVTGVAEKSVISVRIGNQTRLAHLRFFSDQKLKFYKIFEYIARRDLGLDLDAKIGKEELFQFLAQFTDRLAEEAARYEELEVVHGSPTPGNRSTGGGSIDMSTFRFLDAYHSEYRYLGESLQLGQKSGQVSQFRDYISHLCYYFSITYYPGFDQRWQKQFIDRYDASVKNRLEALWLHRLGLSDDVIRKIPEEIKNQFYLEVSKARELVANRKSQVGMQEIRPALIQLRPFFQNALAIWTKSNSNFERETAALIKPKTSWNRTQTNELGEVAQLLSRATAAVFESLQAKPAQVSEFVARAKALNEKPRPNSERSKLEQLSARILAAKSNSASNWQTLTDLAEQTIDSLTDIGVEPRKERQVPMAGASEMSCFDQLKPVRFFTDHSQ